jgi:Protein of unknown function (DUF1501)
MDLFNRRAFLRVGSIGVFGFLPLGEALRLRAQQPAKKADPKDISVIHFMLAGGMSQMDTFDPKPDAAPKFRSIFKPIPTNVAGIQVCEHLPHSARIADKYVVIRSMTHKASAHEFARALIMSGHERLATIQQPVVGSVVAKELGSRNELPAYVAIPASGGPSERGGFLGPKYNPFNAGDPSVAKYSVRDLDLPMGVDWSRMEGRHSLLSLVDSRIRSWDTSDTFETLDSYYKSAFDLMRSPAAKKAFDIAQEPDALRDKYGRTTTGQGALLARRLVESGVRFVTLGRGGNAWDHHTSIFPNLSNEFLPELDKAFSSLVEDLSERGMLDTTLVIVTGEFGRTPELNVYAGRDHWPNCFSLVLAGGGIEGGRVWGASDKDGMFVKDSPVEVPDLIATVYHKLGIDYTKEHVSNIGRPIKLAGDGKPLAFL